MRKFSVGLLVLGLLMFAGQASASQNRDNGTGDPKGLIASGAIQPFWNDGGNIGLIVITSPVGDNSDLHVVFFDATCKRLFSDEAGVTEHGVKVLDVELPLDKGLAALGARGVGTLLKPAQNPFHVFSLWINAAGDFIRVSDSISLDAAETKNPTQTWNPMRSGAYFGAPQEGLDFHTELFFICPSSAVLDELSPTKGFPPPPAIASTLKLAIYDHDEQFLQDIKLACGCIAMYDLDSISPVYRTHVFPVGAPHEFYTEVVTYVDRWVERPPSFYGFRAVTVSDALFAGGSADDWTRLNNGSAAAYFGHPWIGAR